MIFFLSLRTQLICLLPLPIFVEFPLILFLRHRSFPLLPHFLRHFLVTLPHLPTPLLPLLHHIHCKVPYYPHDHHLHDHIHHVLPPLPHLPRLLQYSFLVDLIENIEAMCLLKMSWADCENLSNRWGARLLWEDGNIVDNTNYNLVNLYELDIHMKWKWEEVGEVLKIN